MALTVDLIQILSQHGNSVVSQIRQNMASTGTDATGQTSRSLHFEVRNQGDKTILTVLGKPFFMVVETGRKPTPQYTQPSKEFVASIKQWADTKGLGKFAYGIAKSIHQKGTKLYRDGGRKDIVSNVVNEGLSQQIAKDILTQFSQEYIKHAKLVFNNP